MRIKKKFLKKRAHMYEVYLTGCGLGLGFRDDTDADSKGLYL